MIDKGSHIHIFGMDRPSRSAAFWQALHSGLQTLLASQIYMELCLHQHAHGRVHGDHHFLCCTRSMWTAHLLPQQDFHNSKLRPLFWDAPADPLRLYLLPS